MSVPESGYGHVGAVTAEDGEVDEALSGYIGCAVSADGAGECPPGFCRLAGPAVVGAYDGVAAGGEVGQLDVEVTAGGCVGGARGPLPLGNCGRAGVAFADSDAGSFGSWYREGT